MKQNVTFRKNVSDGKHDSHPSHFPQASHLLERPIGAANAALDAESAAVLEAIKGLLA